MRRLKPMTLGWPLIAIAIVGFVVLLVRACNQSITIDEAYTFTTYVWRSGPAFWTPSSSNHVLNSMLEVLFVKIFGPSTFVLRIPSMIGAALYLLASVALCSRFCRGQLIGALTLSLLILNPFVQDYLVIARGYSLALGFLFVAIYLYCVAREEPASRILYLTIASAAVGISISANFSFGIVGLCTLISFGTLIALRDRGDIVKVVAANVLTAPIVVLCVCGPAFTRFPKSELYYGTHSILDMLESIIRNTFDGPNPFLVNPFLLQAVQSLGIILPVALLFLAAYALWTAVRLKTFPYSNAMALGIVTLGSLACQIIFASTSHTPFPVNRTVMYVAPVFTIFLALTTSIAPTRVVAASTAVIFAVTAFFFAESERMFFREWAADQNTLAMYDGLRRVMTGGRGLTIGADWDLTFSLNFYQVVDRDPQFPLIVNGVGSNDLPEGRSVYAVVAGKDDAFISKHQLRVVYRIHNDSAADSEIAVARDIQTPVFQTLPQ